MFKLILSLCFCFCPIFSFAQVQIMSEAKPYKTSVTERIPFIKSKKLTLGFVRVFTDSRPMVGITPVNTFPETEFEPEFYDCLNAQVQELSKAIKSSPEIVKDFPLSLLIGVRQIELPFIESLCQPASYLNTVNNVIMTICFSGSSSLNSKQVCKIIGQNDIVKSFKNLKNNPDRLKVSFDNLKKSTDELNQLINK